MYDYYSGPKGNPMAVDPSGGLYQWMCVSDTKSMVGDKKLAAVLPLDKLWDPRFVNGLGEHGWFDVTKGKRGLTLQDLLAH